MALYFTPQKKNCLIQSLSPNAKDSNSGQEDKLYWNKQQYDLKSNTICQIPCKRILQYISKHGWDQYNFILTSDILVRSYSSSIFFTFLGGLFYLFQMAYIGEKTKPTNQNSLFS